MSLPAGARRWAASVTVLAIVVFPLVFGAPAAYAVPPDPPSTDQMFTPWYTDDPQENFGVQGNLIDGQGTTRIDLYVTQDPLDPLSWVPYCSDSPIVSPVTVWFCDPPTSTLSPGVNYLAATATNIDGESLRGNIIEITLVDTPTITSPAPGTLTNDDTPDWVGTADPVLVGGFVDVRETLGGTVLCTGAVDAVGDWSCTTAPALADASYDVFVDVTPGWQLLSAEQTITIDTTPPAEADILSPPPTGPPVGFVYPAETNSLTPVISGTSEPGATINLYQDFVIASCAGGPPVADGAGNWSCTITTPLTVGQFYQFGTTTVDAAGNISTMGTPDTQILLEILPPPPAPPAPPPPPTAPPAAVPAPTWTLDFTVSKREVRPGDVVTVSGSGVPAGATVVVELHSTPVEFGRALAAPDGGFSVTSTVPDSVEPGDHEWVVTATPAGEAPVSKRAGVTVLPLPEAEPEPELEVEVEEPAVDPGAAPGAGGAGGASADRTEPAGANVLTGALPTIADVFADPVALGIAGASALILMAFVVFPAELLNNTLASRYGTLFGGLLGGAGRGRGRWVERIREWFARSPLPGAVAIIAAASLIFCFADPGFGLDLASLRLFLACFLALVVVSIVATFVAGRFLSIRWRLRSILEVQPLGLVLAVAGIIVTRLLDFAPGIIIGLVVGLALMGRFDGQDADGRDQARAVATFSTTVLALSVLSWVGYSILLGALGGAPTGFVDALALDTLAAIPAEGLGALLVGLLPLRGLDGAEVWAHSKLGWAVLYGVSLTAFWLIIVADDGNWGEMGGSVVTWGVVLAAFAVIAVGVYLYFRWSDRRAEVRDAQDAAAAESRDQYPPIG
ncbi:MAG: hypothetical protein KF680_09150 [Cryobacterium sp.]|nr:hypothetical protein [Cryobacterium sp.]